MSVTDLRLVETGDGGDVVLRNNDFLMISGFQNMPYIGLFGGNVEESTTGPKTKEEINDFWGNYLFHPSIRKIWFNSETEKLLKSVSLDSSTRIDIENQVKADLEFMSDFANVDVNVFLIGVDRVKIVIDIDQPGVDQNSQFTYIWGATELELTAEELESTDGAGVSLNVILNYDF